MKCFRLSALALCAVLCAFHALADDGDFDFIPPSEIPADATLPQNVRTAPFDLSGSKSSEQWFSRKSSAASADKNDAGTSFKPVEHAPTDELGANLKELLKKARDQKEFEEHLFSSNRARKKDVKPENSNEQKTPDDPDKPIDIAAVLEALPQKPVSNSWNNWVSNDAEFNAKVVAVVEGEPVTNGYVLHRYANYLRASRTDYQQRFLLDSQFGPKAYIELRALLVKRELAQVLISKGFASRQMATSNPEDRREIHRHLEAEFATKELPRLLRAAKVESAEEFENLFPEFSNNIEIARNRYETQKLSQIFSLQHRYLFMDADLPVGTCPPNIAQWVSGTLRYDDGTAVSGAIVSSFLDLYSAYRIQDESGEKSEGAFDCSIPEKQPFLLIDVREANNWPRETFTSDENGAEPQKAIVDSLIVRRVSDKSFVKRDIVVPRSKWCSLTLTWRGETERKLLTVFVTPFLYTKPDEIADALAPSTTDEPLDTDLRYVRSFPIVLEKDNAVVIPNLPPGRCVVVVQSVYGKSPQIQTTQLPSADELTFNPREAGMADVRIDGSQILRLGSPPSGDAREQFRDLAAGLRMWRDALNGDVDPPADAFAKKDTAGHSSKLEYELRFIGPGWDSGFLLWSSMKGDRRSLTSWNPDDDALYPGRYALIVRVGSRSKRMEFEVRPSEKTTINFKLEELTDPNAVEAAEEVPLFR